MVHSDDRRMLERARTLGLLSEEDAKSCLAELEAGTSQRLAQVLMRRRLLKADIIMTLMKQVRDLVTTHDNLIGKQTWTELSSISDVIPPVRAGDSIAGLMLTREVARGGMGILYEAKAQDGKRYAVKILSPTAASSEGVLARFAEEARLAAALDHPNLIKVRHAGTEAGVQFLVMDFFEGKALSDLIRPGRLTPKKSLEVLGQISGACAYMHAQNVFHRDIKPANIMVGRNKQVCLTDFGLAKDAARYDSKLTQMGFGKLLGTPAYMSPEQARGELQDIGPWSDVYAMGAVVYRCLTGRFPFAANSYMKTIQAIALGPAPRLINLRPDAPPELDELVSRAMAHEPPERPGAQELSQGLLALAAQGLAMPPGPPGEAV